MDKNQIQQAITQGQTQGVVTQQGKKYPLVHSLPSSIVNNLPEIVKLEISQLKLKQAPQNEKQQFVNYVFNTFDPNFYSEEEAIANQATVYQFIEDCELTLNEIIKAVQMVLNGTLTDENSEVIVLRHKISLIVLYQIKRAYIRYKNEDYNHTKGRRMITEATNKKQEKTMTAQDKVLLFLTGIMNAFEHFKADNQLCAGDTQYCDGLYHLGLLVPTSQQLETLNERTFQELRQELAKTNDRKEHSQIKQVIHGMLTDDIKFKIKRRKLLLADFFTDLIRQGKSISDAIQPRIEGKNYEEILKILKI